MRGDAGMRPGMGAVDLAELLGEFQRRLLDSDYTEAGLRRVLGITYPDDVGLLNHAPALERATEDSGPAALLTRLFFLEAPVPEARVARVLPRELLGRLLAARLLRRRSGELLARLRVDVLNGLHLLADRRFRRPDRAALRLPVGDMVYPPCSDSAILAAIAQPRADGTTLDLCTGSGIQALAAARASRGVVAVDVTERAVAVARLNAAMNGVANVEVRVGDLYRPVRGERFDTILANPPFVPSPHGDGPSYHSGGPRGDRVLRRFVRGWAEHLRPGGRAFAISHLGLRSGETVESVVAPWLGSFPGRTLVLVLEKGSPIDLAAAQSLFALDHGLDAYAAEVRRWTTYLRRQRITEVVLLVFAAERTPHRELKVADALQRCLPLPLSRPPQDHVAEWLGAPNPSSSATVRHEP